MYGYPQYPSDSGDSNRNPNHPRPSAPPPASGGGHFAPTSYPAMAAGAGLNSGPGSLPSGRPLSAATPAGSSSDVIQPVSVPFSGSQDPTMSEPAAKRRRVDLDSMRCPDYLTGNMAYEAKNYKRAAECFSAAIKAGVSNEVVYAKRAMCFILLNDLNSAMPDCNKAIELAPDWHRGYFCKAELLYNGQNLLGAQSCCKKGLERSPTDPELKAQLKKIEAGMIVEADRLKEEGNKSFADKDYSAAITTYTKALQFHATNHVLYSNRSACYCALKDFDKALKDANKCVKLQPEFAKGYSRKGAALCGLGQKQEAMQAYRKGLEWDPGNKVMKAALEEMELQVRGKPVEAPPKKVFQPVCKNCLKEGHLAHSCPERKPTAPMAPGACINCGELGHKSRDCPYPKQVFCRGCGAAGHVLRDCPNPSTPVDYQQAAADGTDLADRTYG